MEVQRVSDTSFKIKSKNASFLIDPSAGKTDSEILVFTSPPKDYSVLPQTLVISGPGEYEVSGVSIKGENHNKKCAYDFLEENQKILVAAASSVTDIKELEEYGAIIIIADQALGDTLGEIAAEVIIIVSSDEFLPQDKANIQKVEKINLKKMEEYKGFILHLTK